MLNSRVSLIRRHFRQRFGIASAKVGVRSEVQWYWKCILWAVILSLAIIVSQSVYDAGRRFAGYDRTEMEGELSELKARLSLVTGELAKTTESSRTLEGRLQVEVAAIEQIGQQMRALQRENAALKEDLALFEGLVSEPVIASEAVKVARVRVEPATLLGRYRFSVLLVRQVATRSGRDFSGELQFVLKVRRSGGDAMITIPGEGNPAASHYRFSVKHFYRAEGEFTVPGGAEIAGGEVKLLQDGVVRLRQPIHLDLAKSN